jgi:hypothetical protein
MSTAPCRHATAACARHFAMLQQSSSPYSQELAAIYLVGLDAIGFVPAMLLMSAAPRHCTCQSTPVYCLLLVMACHSAA